MIDKAVAAGKIVGLILSLIILWIGILTFVGGVILVGIYLWEWSGSLFTVWLLVMVPICCSATLSVDYSSVKKP